MKPTLPYKTEELTQLSATQLDECLRRAADAKSVIDWMLVDKELKQRQRKVGSK